MALGDEYFGEGITLVGGEIIQLTWRNGEAFVYDRESFRRKSTFHYAGEGWGLAYDGRRLVMSDGTATLRFRDPKTFHFLGKIEVADRGRPVRDLNELEFVEGEIFANVWHTDRIARIDPETGRVNGWIDLSGLWPRGQRPDRHDPEAVLNGIAYDSKGKRLFVSGKKWPKLFEVRVARAG